MVCGMQGHLPKGVCSVPPARLCAARRMQGRAAGVAVVQRAAFHLWLSAHLVPHAPPPPPSTTHTCTYTPPPTQPSPLPCIPSLPLAQLMKLMEERPDVLLLAVNFDENKTLVKALGVKVRHLLVRHSRPALPCIHLACVRSGALGSLSSGARRAACLRQGAQYSSLLALGAGCA